MSTFSKVIEFNEQKFGSPHDTTEKKNHLLTSFENDTCERWKMNKIFAALAV